MTNKNDRNDRNDKKSNAFQQTKQQPADVKLGYKKDERITKGKKR